MVSSATPSRRTYLATVAVEDETVLGYQWIFLPLPRRERLEAIGDVRISVNGDIWPAAANRHAERVVNDRIAAIIGSRGLQVEIDLTTGMGEIRYTPLFGRQGLLATITVESTNVLAEVEA